MQVWFSRRRTSGEALRRAPARRKRRIPMFDALENQNRISIFDNGTVLKYLIIIYSFLFILNSHAQNSNNNQFSIWFSSQLWAYQEPDVMKDKGPLNGFGLSFKHYYNPNSYFDINYEYINGTTDYAGGVYNTNGTTTPYFASSKNSIWFIDFNYNYIFEGSTIDTILGFGFFFRKLTNADGPSDVDYEREQYYRTIPFNLIFIYKISSDTTLSWKNKYHAIFTGENRTHLGDAIEGAPTLNFTQNDGFGFSSDLEYKNLPWFISLGYEYWSVEDSNIVLGYVEPKNNTKVYRMRLGVTF